MKNYGTLVILKHTYDFESTSLTSIMRTRHNTCTVIQLKELTHTMSRYFMQIEILHTFIILRLKSKMGKDRIMLKVS
jgi:hypothetical protein